jgi:hypothetical protein
MAVPALVSGQPSWRLLNLITLQIQWRFVLFPVGFKRKRGRSRHRSHGSAADFSARFAHRICYRSGSRCHCVCRFFLKLVVSLLFALPIVVAAAAVLAIEAALGMRLLGWLFERFDVCAELS